MASLLLALIAAAVLGTGLLLVVNRSVVDKAAVTAAPGTGADALEPAAGDTTPAGGTATDGPTGGVTGDTATTRPEPSSGQSAPGTPAADPASPDPASPEPATSGTATTADTTSAPGLPYGTAAAERTAAQAPGELARTGPAVPSSVAGLLVAAGLVLAAVARAAAHGDD